MLKDRSFAHRIHQSNIDRQRNAAFFNSRNIGANQPEPKVGALGHIKNGLKKFTEFREKYRTYFFAADLLITAWLFCIIVRSYFQ